MEIRTNESNEIIEYAVLGGLSDGIEIDDNLRPVDFDYLFKPSLYLYQDNKIIINPNYEEPTISIPDPEPTEAQQQLAQVAYQQMMTAQDVTTLQTQNAQMAYQLMMMQGGKA